MKPLWTVASGVVALLVGGCAQTPPHFSLLPVAPSAITITRYHPTKPHHPSTFVLSGSAMDRMVHAIQFDGHHVMPPQFATSCPAYAGGTPIWDYRIVIHVRHGADLRFTQTTNGCTFVRDDQTGALAAYALPGLDPLARQSAPN